MAVLQETATTPITTEPVAGSVTQTLEPAPVKQRSPDRRWVWAGVALLVVLLAAVVITVFVGPAEQPAVERVTTTAPAVGSQAFLQRLANEGYIPAEAVDQERLLLERLVNQGQVPAAALEPTRRTDPLSTPEEQALLDAVRSGQVPAEALDTEAMRLKRLANEGMIPRAAAR